MSQWIDRVQGWLMIVAMLLLAAIAGMSFVETRSDRAAHREEFERLSGLLSEQIDAINGQRVVMTEALRLEHLPAPRVLVPEPFATVGETAVVRVAAENSGGPARNARLGAVLLCCGRLESLSASPASTFLVRSDSADVRPVLAAGDALHHDVVLSGQEHPVRLTVRAGNPQSIWAWVALRYEEPVSVDGSASVEVEQDLSFVWDRDTWQWQPTSGEQHETIREILRSQEAR